MPRPKGSRNEEVQSTIGGAIEFAVSEIQGLRDEITEWRDNLDGANMSHMPKYDEVSECADYLDNIDELDGLDLGDAADITCNYTIDTRRKASSRAGRMGNALSALSAAMSELETIVDTLTEAKDTVENIQGEMENVDFPGMY